MKAFADINFSSNTWSGTAWTDAYKSTFEYDANGNITHLGFNGKEKDDEMETMDFGARLLDGDLGSWLACDPLAAIYPTESNTKQVISSQRNRQNMTTTPATTK